MTILATGVTKVSGKVADTSGEVVLTAADVGALISGVYASDLNNLSVSGQYLLRAEVTNKPAGASGIGDHIIHQNWDVNAGYQIYTEFTESRSGKMWTRNKAGNKWGVWKQVYDTVNKPTAADIQNVVSPVSSGGIIERGSNSNGEYVKFADGTMICSRRFEAIGAFTVVASPTTAMGGYMYSTTWTSPVPFQGGSSIAPAAVCFTSARTSGDSSAVGITEYGYSSFRVRGFSKESSTSSILVDCTAIGRWK